MWILRVSSPARFLLFPCVVESGCLPWSVGIFLFPCAARGPCLVFCFVSHVSLCLLPHFATQFPRDPLLLRLLSRKLSENPLVSRMPRARRPHPHRTTTSPSSGAARCHQSPRPPASRRLPSHPAGHPTSRTRRSLDLLVIRWPIHLFHPLLAFATLPPLNLRRRHMRLLERAVGGELDAVLHGHPVPPQSPPPPLLPLPPWRGRPTRGTSTPSPPSPRSRCCLRHSSSSTPPRSRVTYPTRSPSPLTSRRHSSPTSPAAGVPRLVSPCG